MKLAFLKFSIVFVLSVVVITSLSYLIQINNHIDIVNNEEIYDSEVIIVESTEPDPELVIEEISEPDPAADPEVVIVEISEPDPVSDPEVVIVEISEPDPVSAPELVIEEISEPDPAADPELVVEEISEPDPAADPELVIVELSEPDPTPDPDPEVVDKDLSDPELEPNSEIPVLAIADINTIQIIDELELDFEKPFIPEEKAEVPFQLFLSESYLDDILGDESRISSLDFESDIPFFTPDIDFVIEDSVLVAENSPEQDEPDPVDISKLLLSESILEIPPFLAVESPNENEYYRSNVEIMFSIFNDQNSNGFDRITRLHWISPDGEEVEIDVQKKNPYTIFMQTEDIVGPLSVKIVVHKDNGLVFEKIVRLAEDLKGPSINIVSPQENSITTDSILIKGTIKPFSEDYVSVDEIDSLFFRIGDEEEKEVIFNESGDFEVLIENSEFSGLFFVNLKAIDKNNHISTLNFPLLGKVPDVSVISKPPVLSILSPEDNSFYYSRINVSGIVSNDNENPETNQISDFFWSYAGSDQINDIDFSRDGSFDFQITAVDINHDLDLVFTIVKEGGIKTSNFMSLKNDRTGPVIFLQSPENNEYYSNSIRVAGAVKDIVDTTNEVKSLYWSISGEPDRKNLIFIEEDGAFDFEIDTESMNGLVDFQLTSSDLNNNNSSLSVELNDGKKAPVLMLESPEPGDEYGAGITLKGKISDPYSWNSEFGGIEKVIVKMIPTGIISSGDYSENIIPVEDNGAFSYIMRTADREGEQNLIVGVLAKNGNYSEKSTIISQSEFPISDFKVSQEGEKLILNWTTLPFISNYNIKYTSDKTDPDSQTLKGLTNIQPPLELSNMEEGALYSFLLTGETDSEIVNSDIVRLIPMSEDTLQPFSKSEFNYIEISWLPVEGINLFNILRSIDGENFSIIAENISDTRYMDRTGIFGKKYDYRVIPSMFTEIESHIVSGELLAEPPLRLTKKDSLMNIKPDSIKISGDYAYVASKDEGLYIVDISDPDNLSIRGFIMIDGAQNLSLSGEYAIVTAGENGFSIVNISEPANPRLIGSRNSTNAVSAALKDEYIYIADGIKGFKIFSMSNLKRPSRVYLNDEFEAYDVSISGQYLYISTGNTGLVIYNISDPESPEFISLIDDANIINSEISGNYCYSASGADGIYIFDISDPVNPYLCSRYSTENARSVIVKDNHLMVADGDGGLVDIDITDPYRPVSFEQINLSYSSSVDVSDNIVLVADRSGLLSVESFQYGQSFKIGEILTDGDAYSATILGDKLYIAEHSSGFAVVKVDDPEDISSENILYRIPSTYAEQIWIENEKLFLADGSGGIKVYLLEEDQFILSEEIEISGNVRNLFISDEYILAAAGKGGIQGRFRFPPEREPQDIENDGMPLEAVDDRIKKMMVEFSIPFPDVRDLLYFDNFIFAADRQKGLLVVDFSIPESYRTVTEIALPGAISIELNENRLFVAHAEGVSIYDISDKNYPDELVIIPSPYVEDIQVKDSILYIAEGHAGLSIYNVQDYNEIIKVSECIDVFADSITVSGDYAYVADSTGINIIKIYIPRWIK